MVLLYGYSLLHVYWQNSSPALTLNEFPWFTIFQNDSCGFSDFLSLMSIQKKRKRKKKKVSIKLKDFKPFSEIGICTRAFWKQFSTMFTVVEIAILFILFLDII